MICFLSAFGAKRTSSKVAGCVGVTRLTRNGYSSLPRTNLRADASRRQGRASKIMLNGVSAARLTVANPPAVITSRSFASPA
jgi:hypothetical protein